MSKEQTPIERLREEIERSEILSDNTKRILSLIDWNRKIQEEEEFTKAKVLEALESKKECLHDWIDGYLVTEWIIECSKCERDLFDVYNQEDAVKILRNRSKTIL